MDEFAKQSTDDILYDLIDDLRTVMAVLIAEEKLDIINILSITGATMEVIAFKDQKPLPHSIINTTPQDFQELEEIGG